MAELIRDNLPWCYREDPWIVALTGAVDAVLGRQLDEAGETAGQILLRTLTWNLEIEERLAGIVPPAGAALSERLSALSAKWRAGGGKADAERVSAVAAAWVDGTVDVGFPAGHILVRFSECYGGPEDLSGMRAAIGEIVPAHLPVDYLFLYAWTGVVELSQEVRGSTLIYHYKLGAWALGQAPFGTMEEEALLMSGPQQIMPPLLEGTAAFTASEIRAARVNGTVRVEDFEIKAADGATVTVRYYLQPEQAARVERLELLGEGDKVLTAAAVDVTLRGPTLLTHIIPVKEGS